MYTISDPSAAGIPARAMKKPILIQNKNADELRQRISPQIRETIKLLNYAAQTVTTIYEKTNNLNYTKLTEAGKNAARQILLGRSEDGVAKGFIFFQTSILNYTLILTYLPTTLYRITERFNVVGKYRPKRPSRFFSG